MTDPKKARLVAVFDTAWEPEAMVVRSLLDAAGIATAATGSEATPDVLPGVGGIVIRVHEDQAEEARRIIAEQHTTSPDDDSDLSGEPAA